MVFVNSQKFACASCIKGHRSSSCHHTDRPLFEIKKKGRPISQCERCRELRKNKHMHVKCTCASIAPSQGDSNVVEPRETPRPSPQRPAQRKVPSTPALPNGLQDLWSQSSSGAPTDTGSKQRVDALLNPCPCKSIWSCSCRGRMSIETVSHVQDDNSPLALPISECCGGKGLQASTLKGSPLLSHGTTMPTPTASSHREHRRLATVPYVHPPIAQSSTFQMPASSPRDLSGSNVDLTLGLDLPPLKATGIGGSDTTEVIPLILPSLKAVFQCKRDTTDVNAAALASLTRCGCGSTCACPGCKEHRGETAALSGEDCPDRCGSCVDHLGGIALPSPFSVTLTSSSSGSTNSCHPSSVGESDSHGQAKNSGSRMSTLDHFHAIAALLPPPPSSRTYGPGVLDPTNVVVYPQQSGGGQAWHKAAGLVQIPPLNCCAGLCKCPGGMCGCGSECGGSCGRHGILSTDTAGNKHGSPAAEGKGKENGIDRPIASCCKGKQKQGEGSAPKPSRNILRL